jgi:LysR family transcriptional regulator, glycine cleavage system transcriptional activator
MLKPARSVIPKAATNIRGKSAIRRKGETLRRLPLASLRVFVASAEHLNFSRAGDALGVSTAAVSMQIRALEEYLRVPLFRRNGRQVELTVDAQSLLPKVRRALEDLELALDALRADRREGHICINVLPSFLQQWLLPRLPDFYARHSGIELRIETSRSLTDFLREDVQAVVRFGLGDWPNLFVEKMLDEWLVPVCAPAVLRKHGALTSRQQLERVPLIHVSSEPWSEWLEGATADHRVKGSSMDDSASAIRAAAAGQGFALGRWSLAADDVESGHLAVASSLVTRSSRGYYFVCPKAYATLDKVTVLREWMLLKAKAFPRPPGT